MGTGTGQGWGDLHESARSLLSTFINSLYFQSRQTGARNQSEQQFKRRRGAEGASSGAGRGVTRTRAGPRWPSIRTGKVGRRSRGR